MSSSDPDLSRYRRQTSDGLRKSVLDKKFEEALEKIFHPDKFDIKRLNANEQGNVDTGKFFRIGTDTNLDNLSGETAGGGEGGTGDSDPGIFRTFPRNLSSLDEPVVDSSYKNSASQATFQSYMKAIDDHHHDQYPHPHHVMHRMKPSSFRRTESEGAFGSQRHAGDYGEHASKAGQRLRPPSQPRMKTAEATQLPTIQDEEVLMLPEKKKAEAEVEAARQRHVATIPEEFGSSPEPAKKPAFSIEPHDDDDILDDDQHTQPQSQPHRTGRPDFSRQTSAESWNDEPVPYEKKVSFGVMSGESRDEESRDEDGGEHEGGKKSKKKSKKRHRHVPLEEDLEFRRMKGSELNLESYATPTEEEEAKALGNRDIEGMAAHRMGQLKGYSRRHISKRSSADAMDRKFSAIMALQSHGSAMMGIGESLASKMHLTQRDRTPHSLFVEMDELEGEQWVETARWIKYEEDREEGAERWGKAHVSTLTFHSLVNLRLCLEAGVMILDLEAKDLVGVVYRVVEEFGIEGIIEEEQKVEVLRVLLFRHKYVGDNSGFRIGALKKNLSQRSLNALIHEEKQNQVQISKNQTFVHAGNYGGENGVLNKDGEHLVINLPDDTHVSPSASAADLVKIAQSKKESILKKIKEGTEGTICLVGSLASLKKPAVAFVRLSEGIIMPNALEVPLPMRFIFILLTPIPSPNMDCHEIGRSFSALMSNPTFQVVCYKIEERRELLNAINSFLDDSVVLPPGDWDSKNLLSLEEIQAQRRRRKRRRRLLESQAARLSSGGEQPSDSESDEDEIAKKEDEIIQEKKREEMKEEKEDEKKHFDPLKRTGKLFGGVINDIKRRYPWYLSDILDGLNMQCFSTAIFIYFACLSGAIAFGGLYGDKTDNLVGVPVTLVISCASGLIFSLLACNPLIITGVTGPVLLFDSAFYGFAKTSEVEFLPWRVWTGLWLFLIALVVAAFQGSTLVRYFTKFTKDIFASLVALLFIFEALNKLAKIFQEHPLTSLEVYCNATLSSSLSQISQRVQNQSSANTSLDDLLDDVINIPEQGITAKKEPNTALLSFILMFGTFFIAYFLKIFRNGKYFGRTIRRALGDFGVPIAIVIMVALDYLLHDTYTQKLAVPTGLQVTAPEKRGWLVSPFGFNESIALWAPFAAVIPALLLYLLLFMETHICELIMLDKTNKKGGGLHWDIVLLCLVNFLGTFLGGPWICAATVRSVSHVSALSVMSTTHAPGESAKVVDVLDQRMTFFLVSILVGLSVLLAPALQLIPYAVLFGVFIYMGVSAIYGGIQLFDRLFLLLMPVKHHPQVSYVRRVKTWKMHMFTVIQLGALAILWVVKSISAVALFFPFFIIATIPLRMALKFIFTKRELNALDGPKAGQVVQDDEPDFYDQAYGG